MFLNLLELPYEFVPMPLAGGRHRTPEFLALNGFGEVPVLEDGDVVLADSTAILVYLAAKYDDSGRWLPRDPLGAAQVQRWLSAASGKIAYGPAAARMVAVFGATIDHAYVKGVAVRLFEMIKRELQGRRYLVGEQATIADVAAFSYIEHAPEGGVPLKPYPNIRGWLANVRALPGFVAMPATQAGVAPEEASVSLERAATGGATGPYRQLGRSKARARRGSLCARRRCATMIAGGADISRAI